MIIILSIFSWQFTLYYTAIILWYQIFSTEVTKTQSNRPARRNRITRMRLDETDVLLESKQFRKSRLPGQEEWWKEIENDLSRRIRWIRLVESWKLDVFITFYWYMKISAGRTWPPGPQHKKKANSGSHKLQNISSCRESFFLSMIHCLFKILLRWQNVTFVFFALLSFYSLRNWTYRWKSYYII